MRKMMTFLVVGAIMVATLAMVGCGEKKLKGTPVANIPPTIRWSNVPLEDSVFRSNALLTWYGTDPDGRVVLYYYLIVLADSVGPSPDSFIANYLPPDSVWRTTVWDTVHAPLYASADTADTLTQYVFVKCQDNDGAFSEVIYRRFSRLNHLPETLIRSFPGKTNPAESLAYRLGDTVWVLPETTALWRGLRITWEGKDTLDFPDEQPDFTYQIRLYGPYDTSQFNDVADTLVLADTILMPEYRQWYDSATGSEWIKSKELVLTDIRTGVYLFTVRARDDAGTVDPTPAWDKFFCIEPVWLSDPSAAKDILLIQATQYSTQNPPAYRGFPALNIPPSFPDTVLAFYIQMIEGAGSYTYTVFGTPPLGNNRPIPPSLAVLARHRMVIVDNMDMHIADVVDDNNRFRPLLSDYLNVGGKVWVIGRQALMSATWSSKGVVQFAASSMQYKYFDLSYATYGDTRANWTIGEFIGASPISGSPFDSLRIDSLRCSYLRQYGVAKVEVLARASNISRTLLTYEAINPDTAYAGDPPFRGWRQGMPVAIVYEPTHRVFKTSYFSFPLYLMDNTSGRVQYVFDRMLAWFLDDESL